MSKLGWLVVRTLAMAAVGAMPACTQTLNVRVPYKLQVNDTIRVKYRYTPQYDETVRVQPDGSASLQLAGHVELAGHTLAEVRDEIVRGIGTQLVDPVVEVDLAAFEKPFFVVAGQVATPGRYDLAGPNTSVVEAIAQAGGFKSSSKNTQVMVYHRSGEELRLRYVVDCKKVMQHPTREVAAMAVLPGDVVVVPQNKLSSAERVLKLLNLGVYYPLAQ